MGAVFSVDIPWRLDGEPVVRIAFEDERFLGSRKHSLRFDLYPLNAPSTLGRHYAYWDIPMRYVKDNRFDVLLRDGKLILDRGWRRTRIKPKWSGGLEPLGYCTLHVSLWDRWIKPHEMLAVKSSVHVISPPGKNLPLRHVHLTTTQRCNLDCLMCVRPHAHGLVEADVTEAILGPVLDAGPALSCVSVMGIGEPLLNPRFCQIVQDFKRVMPSYGMIGTNTNGTLIDRRFAEKLVESGINWVYFSLDGAKKETAESIRRGLNFDRALQGIEHVVDYRLKSGRRNLSLGSNFVIQEHNKSEIPDFVRLAGSLGLDHVSFNHERDFTTGKFVIQDEEKLTQLFRQAISEAARNGVKVGLPGLRKQREPKCLFMEMCFITLAGDVVPCCRSFLGSKPEEVKRFGNVKEKRLIEIWEDPEYRAFRRQVVDGELPDYCKPCEYALGLLHQHAQG